MKKVLFVVTSHDTKGITGQKTGYYLSEVSHVWHIIKNARYTIDFVSIEGGTPPVDGFNLEDPINKEFVEDKGAQDKINHSLRPSQVKAEEYDAIYYAGGHGAMWDLPHDKDLAHLACNIYERGGVIGAVCHGPAGLVNVKLSNGEYLVKGKAISSFTNEEEEAAKLSDVVPFLLESKLIERGAKHKKSPKWQPHVEVSERLITGQNPASAKLVGEEMVKLLELVEVE